MAIGIPLSDNTFFTTDGTPDFSIISALSLRFHSSVYLISHFKNIEDKLVITQKKDGIKIYRLSIRFLFFRFIALFNRRNQHTHLTPFQFRFLLHFCKFNQIGFCAF